MTVDPRSKRVPVFAVIFLMALALAGCTQSGNQGAFDVPAFGERLMYISGVDGYLYAIDREFLGPSVLSGGSTENQTSGDKEDGSWWQPVGDELDLQPLVAGPALHLDADVPIVVVGSEDGNLYGYDAEEGGDPLWTFPTGDKIWSTAVIKNGIAYFGSHDENVYAVNVFDGTEEWRFSTGGAVAGKPLLFNDLVVVGSFDEKLYALEADSGVKRWEFEGKNWFWAGPVADQRSIFAPSMDGNIYAIDGDGQLLWKCDLGSSIVSRPALISGALAVAAKNGKVVSLLDTDPNILDPDPVADCNKRLIDSEFVTDDEIKAPLFVVGSTIYVGTWGSAVIRLDLGTKRTGSLDLDEIWCFDTKSDTECE